MGTLEDPWLRPDDQGLGYQLSSVLYDQELIVFFRKML